jgi:hypothetical protein
MVPFHQLHLSGVAVTLVDARGVAIAPGDTVIYGFGVSRSVAMAEAVVLGEHADHKACLPPCLDAVSLTASGRVRLRVVRRSYSSGEKPVVDVAPDRLVVLKNTYSDGTLTTDTFIPTLPPSPLPTQDEAARADIETDISRYTAHLRAKFPPPYWVEEMPPGTSPEVVLADYLAWCARQLTELRKKLKALDG